uniref:Uncharacterized protein n=1 Tax=Bionectria ochroleuca TaxID=29856 RepID=A0A8H7NJY8_BIOOC
MTGCKACGLNYTGAAKVCQCVKRDSQNFHQAGGHQYGTSLGQSAPKRLKVAPDKHGKAPGSRAFRNRQSVHAMPDKGGVHGRARD